MNDIKSVLDRIRVFGEEREWQQFHSPKNISMALSVEASELLEHFQWMTQEQSRNIDAEKKQEVSDEIADVFLYLLRMCDQLDINLIDAAHQKIDKNAVKYPIEKSKGVATKYDRL